MHAGHILLQPEVAGALLSQEQANNGQGERQFAHRAGAQVLGLIADVPLEPGDRPRPRPSEKTVKTHVSNIS
ncbi:hypothetical protein [Streptomyces sp. KL116D]|uniref:hypothetical protein n=1 Tax=Streptomyces sp. KL116D TaxID=3045152 RepID=UPI003558AAF0